jgi:hypothetical protein
VRAAARAARATARQQGRAHQARRPAASRPSPALRPTDAVAPAILDRYRTRIKALDREEQQVIAALEELVRQSGSTLGELCGLSTPSVAELLVETGDVRRLAEGGFRRFNATAPLPASTAEGPGEPVRHRCDPGGNRRINAILERAAGTPPNTATNRSRRPSHARRRPYNAPICNRQVAQPAGLNPPAPSRATTRVTTWT